MISVLRIFFRAKETNPWLVLFCLGMAGLFESVGLASLLPVLSIIMEDGSGDTSPLNQIIMEGLGFLGLKPELGLLLTMSFCGILLKAILTMIAMRFVGYAVAEVASSLRGRLIKQLLNVKWTYFTHQPLGRITNAVSVDATRSGEAYQSAASFLTYAIQALAYLTVAFLVSWKVAAAAILVGGGIAFILHFLVRIARKAGRRQTQRTSELVTYLSDALSNIKPLKAMAKQGKFANLFDKKIEQLRRALRRQVISKYALRHMEEVLVALCICLGFYYATTVWAIPPSQLVITGFLLLRTISSVGRLQRQFQIAVLFESPYWAMQDLIEESNAAKEHNPGTGTAKLENGCRFEEVCFAHDGHPVLEGLSMEVPTNRLTVITGASGAGKTTVTDLLLGLYQPDQGAIYIDDMPLREIDLESWRGIVGYVPQEVILFHDTILANVTLGDPRIGEAEARAALEAVGAWDFVAKLPDGLESIVGEKGTKLSGGQRQRLALARALAGDPRLLILDEVTSALDPASERDICQSINALSGRLTVLAITHREAWIDYAERLYHLEGRKAHLIERKPAAAETEAVG